MLENEENTEILFEIKSDIPQFDEEELIEYIKWSITNLHNSVKNEKIDKIKVSLKKEFLQELLKEKDKYRMIKDVDHISIQYAKLYDYIKNDEGTFIKIYFSIYFYDDVENNISNKCKHDGYWNDIWIVTIKRKNDSENKENNNCPNCGAAMKYNKILNTFECNYCKNTFYNRASGLDWEICNIELENS